MKPAVPCPAPALQEDSDVGPTMPGPSAVPDEPAPPVTPVRVIVPFGDFLERRKERYGAASESARKDVERSGK
jgi:hypothetical protein